MNNPKLCSALGFAARAGSLCIGDAACENAVRQQKVCCVLVEADASERTRKKYSDKCRTYQIPLFIAEEGIRLGACVGHPDAKIIGITDPAFYQMIQKQINQPNRGGAEQ